MWRQTSPQGGTRFRMLRVQFWTLAQSKYISEGTQKWTLLGSKVVPPGGPVFGPFILSDVLKLCKLLLFEALVADLVAMMCDADVCS